MEDLKLDGQVALVTGGGRGIGAAISARLASAGAYVVVHYGHSREGAEAVVSGIREAGGAAEMRQADLSNAEAAAALVTGVAEDHQRLDVLVNNAGIVRDNLLLMMKDADWDDVMAVNLRSVAATIKAAAQPMMFQRGGAIINISSTSAQRPNRGQANYAASKGALEALTRAMAAELGRKNVRVNAVAPGMIVTDMSERVRKEAGSEIKKRVLLRRFGKSEEIAAAVHFLASPAAAYVTGQILTVDGGLTLG